MKRLPSFILPGAMVLCAGMSPLHGATTVTSGDISAAATNPDTADLGDVSITIGDFTIASTGTSPAFQPGNGNLAYSFVTGGNPEYIGAVGGVTGGFYETTEKLTLSFTSPVSVTSLTLGGHGRNDLNSVISGFSTDPGASVSGLPAGWTVGFASGAVTIASNNITGFLETYTVEFTNAVNISSLELSAPNVTGGAGGLGFVEITYVPEPSAALLGGLGMLFLLRRRR